MLGALFLALSVRVGKSVFFYFYDSIADAYIQFGLFACWLIGPFLYYYSKSAVQPKLPLKREFMVVTVSLACFSLIINFLFPWSNYPVFWTYFVRIIYLQWLFFVILTGWMLYRTHDEWFLKSKNRPFKLWILSIYFGNVLICLAFNTGNYTSYIAGALSFSFVFYALILMLLFHKRSDELLFLKPNKYQSNKLSTIEAKEIQAKLENVLVEKELFLDADLSLQKVSEFLKVPTIKVSQTLNEHCNINFNDYINTYRIEVAKKMIVNKSALTLESIAMDCGFNSKSTFYSAFKKNTGMTPSQFRNTSTL
ncbi:MAG: helix-turn-helix domain-containing protein [Croceivirga sp.]